MKVYVVTARFDYETSIEGIFTTRKAAEAFIEDAARRDREHAKRVHEGRTAAAAKWVAAGGALSEPVKSSEDTYRDLHRALGEIEEHELRE
jgi:hypothetical protein